MPSSIQLVTATQSVTCVVLKQLSSKLRSIILAELSVALGHDTKFEYLSNGSHIWKSLAYCYKKQYGICVVRVLCQSPELSIIFFARSTETAYAPRILSNQAATGVRHSPIPSIHWLDVKHAIATPTEWKTPRTLDAASTTVNADARTMWKASVVINARAGSTAFRIVGLAFAMVAASNKMAVIPKVDSARVRIMSKDSNAIVASL